MTGGHSPALSVVVVPVGDTAVLGEAIDAVRREGEDVSLEIIVPCTPLVDRALESLGPERRAGVSRPAAAPGAGTWELRSTGVTAAQAPIIATIEDQTVPERGWAAAVLAAHDAPHAAIGGAVHKGAPDSVVGWAMYFVDYWRYLAPREGRSRFLSSCNVSYKRAALARIAPVWRMRMHETDVHAALLEAGETLWLDPRIAVRQRRRLRFTSALREMRRHGQLYGADRTGHVSPGRRVLAIAALPALPPLNILRALSRVMRAPRLLPRLLVAAPVMSILALAWSVGELRGLLSGRPHD